MATEAAHVNYPHEPGRLYDCPGCESECNCTPGDAECVFEGTHNGNADRPHIAEPKPGECSCVPAAVCGPCGERGYSNGLAGYQARIYPAVTTPADEAAYLATLEREAGN